MTQLHLVGGFLGSGKTTAIISAAKVLLGRGRKVGVITNDQGKYLVDTAFVQLADLPAVEVGGGCFCCNYDALDARLDDLIASAQPDVIFAESVGSCADIVATVVKPLLALRGGGVEPQSFSVFADSRLLLRRLSEKEMPFSDDVVYIYDQQLAEAGLIVANKIDLLDGAKRTELERLLTERFPGTPYRMQTSLDAEGTRGWVDMLETGGAPLPERTLDDLDYARYGAGEARLAWLDAQYRLGFPSADGVANRALLLRGIDTLLGELSSRGAGIGHLKLIVGGVKLSFPTLAEPGWQERLPELPGETLDLLLNARAELGAEELEALAAQALRGVGIAVTVGESMAFHPKEPKPTHRIK